MYSFDCNENNGEKMGQSPILSGFPSRLENLENGKTFSSQGILTRLEQSHKILENWGDFRQMLLVIFQWQLKEFVHYLLNLISVKKESLNKNAFQ